MSTKSGKDHDNGRGYKSHLFLAACQTLKAGPLKTRPYTPRTNGKAKRFIQTSLKERAYKQAYETSDKRKNMLQPWLDHYNTRRPHAAMNHKPPISRLPNREQRPC